MQIYKKLSTWDLCYTTYSQAVSRKNTILVTQLCIHLLFYRVGTVLGAPTFFAVFATPYAVEMLPGIFYEMRVIGQDSGLATAAVSACHTHSGTG